MKSLLLAVVASASMLVAAQAVAADAKAAEALAQKNGCLACHSVEKAAMGPAYKEVSEKYKGDKNAETKLIAKVKAGGGGGVWKQKPMMSMMPPQTAKDEDIKIIVQWVLSL